MRYDGSSCELCLLEQVCHIHVKLGKGGVADGCWIFPMASFLSLCTQANWQNPKSLFCSLGEESHYYWKMQAQGAELSSELAGWYFLQSKVCGEEPSDLSVIKERGEVIL